MFPADVALPGTFLTAGKVLASIRGRETGGASYGREEPIPPPKASTIS